MAVKIQVKVARSEVQQTAMIILSSYDTQHLITINIFTIVHCGHRLISGQQKESRSDRNNFPTPPGNLYSGFSLPFCYL